MAFTYNLAMQNVSGMIGKELVFKKYYDKTVVSKKPDMSKRVLSPKQIETNERMRLATIYAKYIFKERDKFSERVRLKVPTHKSLFHALVKEFLDKNKAIPLAEVEDKFQANLTQV